MSDTKIGAGNVEITLDGKKVYLVPTYDAFSKINRDIPGGLVAAIDAVAKHDINAMFTVITHGVGFTLAGQVGLGEKIFKAGVVNVAPKVIDYLIILNNGGSPSTEVETDDANPQATA